MPKKTSSTTAAAKQQTSDLRTIFTILLLIFVYPLGLLLMYFWTSWPRWVKVVVSLPLFLIVLPFLAVGILSANNPALQVKKAECTQSCQNDADPKTCANLCVNDLYYQQTN